MGPNRVCSLMTILVRLNYSTFHILTASDSFFFFFNGLPNTHAVSTVKSFILQYLAFIGRNKSRLEYSSWRKWLTWGTLQLRLLYRGSGKDYESKERLIALMIYLICMFIMH